MSDKQQRLVLSIIDFLNSSINEGTVKADDKESLEVAIQCIGEAFGVDPSNQDQVDKLSVKPATLQSIFDVYMKTRDKVGARTQPPATSSEPAESSSGPSADDKAKADKLKQDGNSLMSNKKYTEAIAAYTQAIELDASNPVYFSNRAAAYSSSGDHLAAIGDAENAISVDSSFSKAYHRLGHAHYCLGDFKSAADAFERGLKIEPNNAGLKSGLKNAKDRIKADEADVATRAAPSGDAVGAGAGAGAGLGGMADMFRNMAGGGGGMPDLASLMNNPQVMQMAQQMASNGGLAQLMQNPTVASMMERVQNGNMPSMSELMSDPSLRDLASQFGAGATNQPGQDQQ